MILNCFEFKRQPSLKICKIGVLRVLWTLVIEVLDSEFPSTVHLTLEFGIWIIQLEGFWYCSFWVEGDLLMAYLSPFNWNLNKFKKCIFKTCSSWRNKCEYLCKCQPVNLSLSQKLIKQDIYKKKNLIYHTHHLS